MKKFFEKHTIAKIVGIIIFVAIVLTWIFDYGAFQGSEFTTYGKHQLGFSDITSVIYNSIYFAIDKVIYLLILGGFYAVLSKTSGYKKLISNITKKIKGKEHIFVVVTSIVLTILTSIITQTYAMLIFVPLLITIMLNAGVNKLTAFASTFGAILVGVLGATYGTDALIAFNTYYSQTIQGDSATTLTIAYRIIILCIGIILYNFFLYFAAKKSLEKNDKKALVIDEEFKVEDDSKNKAKLFPIVIVLSLLGIITVLGFVDWAGVFKINIFTDFHKWLTELKVGKDFTLISHILGTNAAAFGGFDLFAISTVLLIFTVLTAILYSIKLDDLLSTFGEGIKRIIKPVGALVGVYMVFIIMYMSPVVPNIVNKIMKQDGIPNINVDYKGANIAIFNVDTDDDQKADYNLINQDTNKDGKCDLNCDTNKDGFPDKNIDFNADGKSDDYDATIDSKLTGTSTMNIDSNGDGKCDINCDLDFSLPKTIVGAFITNIFHVDLGYTGYAYGSYLVSTFGSTALALVFLVFFAMYGFMQLFIPTSVLLVFGLTYAKVDYKDWLKYIWRFLVGMFVVLLIIFIFMACI